MTKSIYAGATNQTVYFHLRKASDGTAYTGLAYNTSGLKAYYNLNRGAAIAITLATLASANSAYSSGGFKEVDATNMPGVYRLDLPDAAVATSPGVRITISGATDLFSETKEVELTAYDPYDSVRLGLTALPNAAAESSGGLITRGTGTGQMTLSSGTVTVGTNNDKTGYSISGTKTTLDSLNDLSAAGVRTALGLASANLDTQLTAIDDYIDTEIAAIKAKTDQLTFSTTNRVDCQVYGMEANVMTAAAAASDLTTELQSGLATAASIAALNNLSAAQVNAEVDTALADIRLDELLAADSDIDGLTPPTVGSVFHELMTKTAGSFTYDQTTDSLEAVRDRGDAAWITATGFSTHSAADVWSVATRVLTAGTNIVLAKGAGVTGFNDLDASGIRTAVGLSNANLDTQLTTIDDYLDTEVSAIKAKTDQMTFSTANRIDAQIFGMESNTLTAAAMASDAVTEIQSGLATAVAVSSLPTAAQNATAVLTTQLTEGYAADGVAPTVTQALMLMQQSITDFSIVGTTLTVKKLDGSTTAATMTLNDATSPTSVTRSG